MSNIIEFTIAAKDQASKVVNSVQLNMKNFGKDLARIVLGVGAPIALANKAFNAIGDEITKLKEKIKDAVDSTAELGNKAADLGVSVEEYQKLSNAADAAGMSLDKVAKAYSEVQKLLATAVGGGNDTAKMLEVLGFAADDIANGLVKPMDVIEKLGAAMLGAKDDTTAMKIATAVLGETLAKDLLPQLKAAQALASGFGEDSGLTEGEVEIVRQERIVQKQKKNREEAETAKTQVSLRFLQQDSPEARALILKEQKKRAEQSPSGEGGLGSLQDLASDPELQNEVVKILEARAAAEKERLRIANEAKANEIIAAAAALAAANEAQAFADKAIADAMTQAEKDDAKARQDAEAARAKAKAEAAKATAKESADADKTAKDKADQEKKALSDALDAEAKATGKDGDSKMTLSSLREIGGGLAGEAIVNSMDLDRQMLDINQKMLIELQKLNVSSLPAVPTSTDFTKLTTTA